MKPVPWAEVRKLVVCRTDHIGDFIVSTGALRALRHYLPDREIWGLVQPPLREWLIGTRWLDRVLVPEDRHLLGLFQPDLALGFSPRSATYRLLQSTGARFRVGYCYSERPLARLHCLLALTHTWTVSLEKPLRQGARVPHEAEVVSAFLEATGLGQVRPDPELPLSAEWTEWGKRLVEGRTVLHFAPRWLHGGRTLEDFFALASRLAPVVVTVGPAERSLLPSALPVLEGVQWLEDLRFVQWAAVLGAAGLLVSTDTGAVHVAAARGRPVVVVYLPEQYRLCSQQWYPWGVPYRALQLGRDPDFQRQLLSACSELLG